MAQIRKGTTYATGDQVTATNLNTHVDGAILLPGAVTEQVTGTVNSTDTLLAADSSLKKLTVAQLQAGLVKTDGTTAMSGELQLSSSTPSAALNAASKGYVDSAVSTSVAQTVSAGCIMLWPSATAPSGWLECNGQSATTSALQAVVGANVPDLRGQFVRGWQSGSGIDSGRTIKSSQAAYAGNNTFEFVKHDGDVQTSPYGEVIGVTINSQEIVPQVGGPATYTKTIDTNAGDTRPTNVALMYIIKT